MPRAALPLALVLIFAGACSDDGGRSDASTDSTSDASTSDDNSTSADNSTDSADAPTDSADGPTDSADTGDPDGSYCAHQCRTDADCLVGGTDTGYTCVDSFCVSDLTQCGTDDDCVALFSGWSQGQPCTAVDQCAPMTQTCLDLEGEGHCVTVPNDFISCDQLNMVELSMTDIEGNPVTVCGQPDAICLDAGYCHLPCKSDTDCPSAAYPACNVGTGFCECTSDAGCESLGLAAASVCHEGTCGCGTDQDCVAAGFGDLCLPAGGCGCSGDEACAGVTSSFDGGMVSCVPF